MKSLKKFKKSENSENSKKVNVLEGFSQGLIVMISVVPSKQLKNWIWLLQPQKIKIGDWILVQEFMFVMTRICKIYLEVKNPEKSVNGQPCYNQSCRKRKRKINFTFGQKLTLLNVSHVSEIMKNLMFASLLSKRGFKFVIESDHIIVSKSGMFIGKGYHCDDMFKLSINAINYASTYNAVSDSYLWHARLGHLNFSLLNYMSNNDYITSKPDHGEKCEICLQ